MPIYMKIDDIEGDVTAKGYQNWIEIQSLSSEINREIRSQAGRMYDRECSTPTFQDITITKHSDQTTPLLFAQVCHGRAIPQIQIHICHTGDEITPYKQHILHNVLFSHYSEEAASGGKPIERIRLSFTKIETSFTPYDERHSAKSPIKSGYDLATMQKV